ncbi:DUF1178 family protein [Xanthobacter wiegelii]|uniref:DUF1178 family protein n=1 Tax=Xanthobacter wiegelii TaxID=3119913 RepID=UPI0037274C23
MIRYTLKCDDGHEFESWFPSSASYDTQRGRGLVTCPTCNSAQVDKAVMAPSVARTDKGGPAPEPAAESWSALAGAPVEAPPVEATPVPMMARPDGELRTLMRQLRDHIVANSDYVGDSFADLARKMHDGEIEHRPIRGEATVDEVKALHEDEVEIFPLPVLPEDRN